MKTAIIDIGSNSVRLMLWADGKTLYKRLNTTRLGEGIAFSPYLKEEAIERSAQAVFTFYEEAVREGAAAFAFATAAVRTAKNGADFCARVKALCGLNVDVVSGEEEAMLGLRGVLGDCDGAILDVGGASTELCVRSGGKISARSLDVGAVRLYDLCGDSERKLAPVVQNALAPLKGVFVGERLYAVGGTATTLVALKLGLKEYDAEKIQDARLTADELSALAGRLLSLPLASRKRLAGMDERRAEIIAGGAYLVAEAVKTLSVSEIFVSDRDNLEGYLALRGLK